MDDDSMDDDSMDDAAIIKLRSREQTPPGWEARATLQHLAIINYAVPKERLARHIHSDRFDIGEFDIGGDRRALMSAVSFVVRDFRPVARIPLVRFQFGQTNHRVYGIDRLTGDYCVWFLGTTVGSPIVYFPRWVWKLPWHYGKYRAACTYDATAGRYQNYRISVRSSWCSAIVNIEDTGEAVGLVDGFDSPEHVRLIMTHPGMGFFPRLDGKVATATVSHRPIEATVGRSNNIYFSLYERLGLVSPAEMQKPHSIFLCPASDFSIELPPRLAR